MAVAEVDQLFPDPRDSSSSVRECAVQKEQGLEPVSASGLLPGEA